MVLRIAGNRQGAIMGSVFQLEVAANSLASALAAQAGGAARVELCVALEQGGLTPSSGLIAMVREHLHIPLYVLIRPRAGDFLYSDSECELMQRDIEYCLAMGCDGVVLGVLNAEAQPDRTRCAPLMAAAAGMGITFHRAFDLCRDPSSALETLIALGCERVLTSGGQSSALQGSELIAQLMQQAADRIIVMPGAGITPENILELARLSKAHEFHASAAHMLESGMNYRPPGLQEMQGGERRSDRLRVQAMVASLMTL